MWRTHLLRLETELYGELHVHVVYYPEVFHGRHVTELREGDYKLPEAPANVWNMWISALFVCYLNICIDRNVSQRFSKQR